MIIVSCVAMIVSCKKKSEPDTETQSVVDNAICEQEFMQVQPTANSRAIATKGTGATLKTTGTNSVTACDTLTKISGDTSWAMTGHIDPTFEYDFSSCPNVNGDNTQRTGKYRIRLTGPMKVAGKKMIIKLLNYVVNGNITYSCDSIIITNLSTVFTSTVPGTIPSSYSFRVEIINGVCTSSSGGWTIKYTSDKTITTNTQGTAKASDDVITVNGNSSGTNREGRNFTVNVNSIIKNASCKWISSGTMDLTPDGFKTRTVDYGNGTCDDDATYTVNGQTIAFKLK